MCALLLATVALTGCRFAEHGRRAAIDAFASFVLDSLSRTPLREPAPGKAAVPPVVAPAAPAAVPAPAPAPERQECRLSTKLPTPQPRITIALAPAVVSICPTRRVYVNVPRVNIVARMALAQALGDRDRALRLRRIVVVTPEIDDEALPTTL